MTYLQTIESTITNVLLPKIQKILEELLPLETISMSDPQIRRLKTELKYYRLILGSLREVVEGEEELEEQDVQSILMLCGVSSATNESHGVNTQITKTTVEKPEEDFNVYSDGVLLEDSISPGIQVLKFEYPGPGIDKISICINGSMTVSSASRAKELTYMVSASSGTFTLDMDAYKGDNILFSQRVEYPIL